MEQKILKVGDVIEFNDKKYRVELEPTNRGCRGCVFGDAPACPIQEDCNTNSVILKKVKETPRRHIELGVVKVEGDKVTFKIIEQTHQLGDFCQQIDHSIFKASNGIRLGSIHVPEWMGASLRLFCRGFFSSKDNIEIVCTTSEFARISEAVSEYNITDGKGYEKPWPKKGDRYFYIAPHGRIERVEFSDEPFDTGCEACGNIFRTKEEAEAARDKIRALLKELAAK